MLEALGWGLLAQSSLLVAGLLVCWVTVPTKVVGVLGGFGAGAMIAAVSFDLLPEALAHIEPWQTGVWMLVGVAVFLVADQLVERRFGSQGAGGAMGIVVGSVVDGQGPVKVSLCPVDVVRYGNRHGFWTACQPGRWRVASRRPR
jgi:zinc transporter, ZIP family